MIPIGSAVLERAIDENRKLIRIIESDSRAELRRLESKLVGISTQEEKEYLDKVISFFDEDDFLCINQQEIKNKIKLLPDIPTRGKIINGRNYTDPFLANEILKALDYEKLRANFYPQFYGSLGIRACVYCNSQSTLSVRKFTPETRTVSTEGKFQLDHHYSKKLYPFLSISFYNLYLVCGVCNNVKSKSSVEFDLYGDLPAKPYQFMLSPGSLAHYLTTKNAKTIKIKFFDPDHNKVLEPGYKTFQTVFNIQGIYETQQDLAEELIIKSQMYSETYKNSLLKNFSHLFRNTEQIDRVLIGNYMDITNVHKRPMAKFTQDIARQLKLII